MKEAISTVGQLRALLAGYSDEAPILAQIVGMDAGAWNVFLSGAHGRDCGFNWLPFNPVIFQMWHPDIKNLDEAVRS